MSAAFCSFYVSRFSLSLVNFIRCDDVQKCVDTDNNCNGNVNVNSFDKKTFLNPTFLVANQGKKIIREQFKCIDGKDKKSQ